MSTALKPVRDCGPEFGRRFERGLRVELRAARMFEIGRYCDRFERVKAIQAECDRLLALDPSSSRRTP